MNRTNSDGRPVYLKPLKEQLTYITIALVATLGVVSWLWLWPAWQVLGEHKQRYELLRLQLANTSEKEADEQQESLPQLLQDQNRIQAQWQEWKSYADVTISQSDVISTFRQLAAQSGLQLKQATWFPSKGLSQAKKLAIELNGDFDQVVNFTSAALALDYLFVPLSMHISAADQSSLHFKLTITLQMLLNEQTGYFLKVGSAAKNQRQYWLSRLTKFVYPSSLDTAVYEHNLLPIMRCLDLEDFALTTVLGNFQNHQTNGVVFHIPVKGLRFVEVGSWLQQWRVSHISTQFMLLEKADKTRCRMSVQGGEL